jgi:hypothetical protein
MGIDLDMAVEIILRKVIRPEFLRAEAPPPGPALSPAQRARAKLCSRVCACEACGWTPPPAAGTAVRLLHEHHVLPRSFGGTDAPGNRVILCPNCHAIVHAAITRAQRGRNAETYTGPRTREELLEALAVILRAEG